MGYLAKSSHIKHQNISTRQTFVKHLLCVESRMGVLNLSLKQVGLPSRSLDRETDLIAKNNNIWTNKIKANPR